MKRPSSRTTYVGLDNDVNAGMTVTGNVIRDAWVFGILPETECCEGWELSRIDAVHQQVNSEWDKYGCLASRLPEDLRERHKRIYDKAIAEAKTRGWDPEESTRDEY